MSTLDYARRKRFINAVVAETKLGYRESSEVSQMHYENNTIIMPEYAPDFTDEQDQAWMSELLNGCYHTMPDNIGDSKEITRQGIDMSKPFGQALNLVCRSNAQYKRQGILPGADEYINKQTQAEILSIIPHLEQVKPELQAVKAFDTIARSKWQCSTDYDIRNKVSSEAREMLDKMLSNPTLMSDYLQPRQGGEANIEMTKRLIEEATDEQNAQQMAEEAGANGEDAKQEESEGKSKGGQGSSEGDEGKEEQGEAETEGEQSKEDHETDYDELNKDFPSFNVGDIGGNQTLRYSEKHFQSQGEFSAQKTKIVIPKMDGLNTTRARQANEKLTTTLSTKVRNLLKVYSQAKYEGGKKRGKINKRAIAGITTGNDRIFRKKEIKNVMDTAVMLLVDGSGSMCGSKYTNATAATAMLNDCLGKINIPHAIYSFTVESYDHNLMYKHKDFNKKCYPEDIINSMCSSNVMMGGNNDGDSVLTVHDLLLQQKQKRKILIVLSDGCPTDGGGMGGSPQYLKKIVSDIESKSPVEIYGIGIEDGSVKHFYTNNVVLKSSNELEECLLSVIKNSIIK